MALPPPPQGSLPAGWLAFAGRESNPLDRDERFQFTCSSPFPGLILTLHPPLPSARAAARLPQGALLRPVASRPPPGRRSVAPHAAAPGPAAARTTPGNKGAVVRPNRGRGDRRAAARTQDLPAVSPWTADLHPHPCSGTGHGTVIRRPLTRRRPIPPPRAPARHSTGLTFMPPMAVAMTRTTPTAIPNASRRTIIPRPNASHRRRQTVITTRATQRPG